MLRNLGGGVRPDLADIDLWRSTRLPILEMERLEAELVRDRRPPPTWEEIIIANKLNIGQIAKSNLSWLIKSNYVKASNSLFNNFANNGKKPHHIASHSKCC